MTVRERPPGILAVTGAELTRYILIGAVAIALGVIILQAVRRRRSVVG